MPNLTLPDLTAGSSAAAPSQPPPALAQGTQRGLAGGTERWLPRVLCN